jgi:hypothetical protein
VTLPLELGGIQSPDVRRAFEQISVAFPVQESSMGLRTVSGGVTGATGVSAGTGFTSVRNAAGDYTITFTPVFSSTPILVAMLGATGAAVSVKTFGGSVPSGSTWRLATITGAPALVDHDFYFIAKGPGF